MELGDPGGKSSYYLPYDVSAETPQHYSDSGAAGNVLNMMLVTLKENSLVVMNMECDYIWLAFFLFHLLVRDTQA